MHPIPSQFYKDPVTGTTYTSFDVFKQYNPTGVGGAPGTPGGADISGGGGYQPPAITPESLQPATPAPFVQPTPTAIPDVANLYSTPPLEPTPTETKAQGLSDRLMAINDALVGKTADQATANEQFGVNQAQRTITDLNARLIGLQADQAAIPLLLEKAGSSKGVSSTVIDRQRSSLLRDNAIEALTVSAMMAAASGQLSNAQSLVDKAVAAKYGPLEAEFEAKSNNLKIILNSPDYTREEKNRAQKQQAILDQKQFEFQQAKQSTVDIQKIALDAAANGADSVTLDNIAKAKTPIEAMQAASEFTKAQNNLAQIRAAKVSTPYVLANGEAQDARTGVGFKDPADFLAKTGITFEAAVAKGLVTTINAATTALKSGDTQIVTAGGRQLLVNKLTGEVIKDLGGAYKTGSGSGTGDDGGPPTPTTPKGAPKIPKTLTANSVRTYLTEMKNYFGGENYYDVWGVAADAIKSVGGDPAKFDKTFWDVFRPGEYAQYHQ